MAKEVSPYNLCDGTGLVCENHPQLAWAGASGGACACDCGAGMECEGCKSCTLPPLYAPKSAAKIAEAASLIRKASKLLDGAGDTAVICRIEKVAGTEAIDEGLAARLEALALSLEDDAA